MNENNANFTPAAPNFKTLVKMSFQGLTNFPYIEEDFDALTNYGLLSKVVEYLNEVISNNNEQNTVITNLYNAYISLQNYVNDYFDNLDVQDEINNKLDDMAQDGSLTALIKNYLDPYIAEQNIRIGNVENLVESLASGSPKGVYATTNALITANPETGVYIVTADGHIYSWTHGGNTPVDLGIYQATEVENNSITPIKTNFFRFTKKGNLYQEELSTKNWLINSDNTSGVTNNNYNTSDYIEVEQGHTYYYANGIGYISFYDSSKVYISSTAMVSGGQGPKIITLPENTAYFKVSYQKTNKLVIIDTTYYAGDRNVNTLTINKSLYEFINENQLEINNNNIKDKSILENKVDFITLSPTGNLIDEKTCEVGYKIENGYKRVDSNYTLSDYIKLEDNTAYQSGSSYGGSIRYINFYDENKIFISKSTAQGVALSNVSIPENSKYCRVEFQNQNDSNAAFINKALYNKELYYYNGANYITDFSSDYIYENAYIKEDALSAELKNKVNSSDSYFGDKKINFIGDSITWGYNGATVSRADYPYPTLVKELLHALDVNNYGINGSTLGGDNTNVGYSSMVTRYTNMENDVDYNIVFGGVNDFRSNHQVPLGTNTDTTTSTFYGSLYILINGLIEKYPTKRIAFIIPLRTAYGTNSFNSTFSDYIDAIKYMCNKYSIPYLDLYNNGSPIENTTWKNANMPDGLHPNQIYYYVLAKKIAEFIKGL